MPIGNLSSHEHSGFVLPSRCPGAPALPSIDLRGNELMAEREVMLGLATETSPHMSAITPCKLISYQG